MAEALVQREEVARVRVTGEWSRFPVGLYSHGMHDFVLTEAELGTRVAMALDNEACGFGALFDLSYEQYLRGEAS